MRSDVFIVLLAARLSIYVLKQKKINKKKKKKKKLETVGNEKLRKPGNFVADSEKLPYTLKRNLINFVGDCPWVEIY
jgi:hypothetical protein